MKLFTTLSRAAGLGLCVVAFSGTALADPGNGNGNGPEATPPGQEKKAETPAAPAPAPAPQAAAGQAKKAENQAKKANHHAKKADKKADKAATPSKGQSVNAHHHVIICHRTGSLSNPYVVINIPYTAWIHAHSPSTGAHPPKNGHVDILLKDPASRSGSKDGFTKAGCEARAGTAPATQVAPTQNESTTTTDCPSTTRTVAETVPGYVLHKTGSKTNPYVTIRPSENSAHYDKAKHPDDVIMPAQTVTRTITEVGSCARSSNTTTTATTVQLQALTTTTLSGQNVVVPAQTAPVGQSLAQQAVVEAGGVAGAVSPTLEKKAKSKPAGGVLGAIASAPEAVARTATTRTLPFTGIPLWIAALIGGALLAAGLVLRRTA